MQVKFVRAFSSTIKVKGIEIRNGEILIVLSQKQVEKNIHALVTLGFREYKKYQWNNAQEWLHEDESYFDRIIIGDMEN